MKSEELIRRIEKALVFGGGTHVWEDMRQGLVEGKYQIFENADGAVVTEIIQAPRKRFLQCWVVAGQLPGVMDLHETVDRHALSNDCEFLTTTARLGWQKVLPPLGWKRSAIVFTRIPKHA